MVQRSIRREADEEERETLVPSDSELATANVSIIRNLRKEILANRKPENHTNFAKNIVTVKNIDSYEEFIHQIPKA